VVDIFLAKRKSRGHDTGTMSNHFADVHAISAKAVRDIWNMRTYLEKVTPCARALSSASHTHFHQHMLMSFIYNYEPWYLECAYSKKVPARVRAPSLSFSVSLSQRQRDKEREKEREKERKRQSEGERERELSLFHSLFLSLSLSFIHVTYCTPQPVSALAFSLGKTRSLLLNIVSFLELFSKRDQ